ncbi:MAG: hypothetical protein Q7J64_03735 [Elusimicrobiota bacterium]|nr:hypothetical protein [Elusimicrobiota bacterium]
MKKLLGTTLALAMFVPAGANAELLKNLKVSGQLDIQTTSARNVTDFVTRPTGVNSSPASTANNDRIGHATTRVMVKMDWDILDDVHARVTLVKGAEGGGGTARTYGTAAQSVNGIQDTTIVQEANVKIDKVFGALDVTAGRQFYGEEGDLIIYYGPRDTYGLRVDALDIFRADWNGEHMSITGIAGKLADGTVAQTQATGGVTTAVDLRGLVVSCKMHEMVKPSAYIYNRVTHGTVGLGQTLGNVSGGGDGKNTNLWVAGLKAKIAAGGFTGSAEFAKNFGEDRTTFAGQPLGAQSTQFKGYAIQLKAGYKLDLDSVGAINPWGEYGMGTGDSNFQFAGNNTFQAINTAYNPGGIYGRFDAGAAIALAGNANGNGAGSLAANGLSNRIIWGFGVKATPSMVSKLTVGAAFYRYAYHRVAPNANGLKSSRNIGSEIDVTGEWKHSENVSLKATAGTFQPGAAMYDFRGPNAAVNPAVMLAGDVSIKF